MKKSIIIILAVVAILVIWAVSVYNGLVTMDENVSGQWANVETQYQRRADLIPNLVNTVKGYATHEKETLEGVVAARSQATQIKVDAADLTPEKLAQYQKAQGAVTSALGKLLAITENYPDLKANQNFLELQAQLEGTENRINVARKNFLSIMQDILNEDVGIFISSHITETLKKLADYLLFADNGIITFHCPEQMDAFLADKLKRSHTHIRDLLSRNS